MSNANNGEMRLWGKTVFTAFVSVIVIKVFSEVHSLILNFSPNDAPRFAIPIRV